MEIKFRSHKNHNPECDILEGYLDNDKYVTYGIYVNGQNKGKEFMEYYSGENYSPGSIKHSHSRHFEVPNLPLKYKPIWNKLKQIYQEKYSTLNETSNVIYASPEGGKDRYYCVWKNGDGNTLTKNIWGKSSVEKWKKEIGASKIIWSMIESQMSNLHQKISDYLRANISKIPKDILLKHIAKKFQIPIKTVNSLYTEVIGTMKRKEISEDKNITESNKFRSFIRKEIKEFFGGVGVQNINSMCDKCEMPANSCTCALEDDKKKNEKAKSGKVQIIKEFLLKEIKRDVDERCDNCPEDATKKIKESSTEDICKRCKRSQTKCTCIKESNFTCKKCGNTIGSLQCKKYCGKKNEIHPSVSNYEKKEQAIDNFAKQLIHNGVMTGLALNYLMKKFNIDFDKASIIYYRNKKTNETCHECGMKHLKTEICPPGHVAQTKALKKQHGKNSPIPYKIAWAAHKKDKGKH